jgi:hypothetical protein
MRDQSEGIYLEDDDSFDGRQQNNFSPLSEQKPVVSQHHTNRKVRVEQVVSHMDLTRCRISETPVKKIS